MEICNNEILTMIFAFFGVIIFGYLCGSIPFGLLVSKFAKNVDIRQYGSHNIGSTNVTRVLGKKWGALALLLDGLKAVIPLLLAKHLFGDCEYTLSLVMLATVLGHIFPVWLHFKGGKGIACILFSLFVINWILGLIFLLTWIVTFLLYKISALSALVAMIVTTAMSIFFSNIYFVLLLVLSILTFYKHIENIKRLLNGDELGFKKND